MNVKDKGAAGDGRTDDTAAIQAAIDAVAATGGTALVPDGVYMVSAVENNLKLKSDMTLKLAGGAVLKAIPNDATHYAILTISGVSNVWVTGGTLEGERSEHRGKSGEWGMGIRIDDRAKNITIAGLTSKKMWGDGFYVQAAMFASAASRPMLTGAKACRSSTRTGCWSSTRPSRTRAARARAPASISSPTRTRSRSPMSASRTRSSSTMRAEASVAGAFPKWK
jgi:polygalacturonase